MRHSFFYKVLVLLCASYAFEIAAVLEQPTKTFGFPFFKQRPQLLNTPRRIAGELHHLYKPNLKYINGSLSLIPEYTRSFDREALGRYVFFNGKDTMRFGPANTPGIDVAAREFLLGEDFVADVKAKPRVENFLVEFCFRLGLDEWLPNAYFDLRAPVVWTKWDLNFEETPISAGTGLIPQGEVGNNTLAVKAPFKSIIKAWNGQRTVEQVDDTMNFARVDGGKTKIRLADMEYVIGYNFVNRDWVHFGINLRAIAATSNDPEAEFLFEPLAGDAHHTAVGGGIDGHFQVYNPSKIHSFSFFYFAHMYHMFEVEQPRTFDLKVNGPGSRYLLFKQFNDLNLYDEVIIRGPNLLTFPAKVKIGLEAEATFVFNYKRCNLSVDVGYNIWGRTRESIKLEEGIPEEAPRFGVKGNTNTIDPDLLPQIYRLGPLKQQNLPQVKQQLREQTLNRILILLADNLRGSI